MNKNSRYIYYLVATCTKMISIEVMELSCVNNLKHHIRYIGIH